jgi:hypothetical protein
MKNKKPQEFAAIKLKNANENWALIMHQADSKWFDAGTMACGAVMFVPEDAKKRKVLTFDLFYDVEDILDFWEKHKNGFRAIDIEPENFPKLHEASKVLDLNGEPKVDIEHPSAWAETYAASLFYERGWATHDEINDAIIHAHWMRMYLDAVDEGIAMWYPPGPGDIEIGSLL